jgi:hypothetical protein
VGAEQHTTSATSPRASYHNRFALCDVATIASNSSFAKPTTMSSAAAPSSLTHPLHLEGAGSSNVSQRTNSVVSQAVELEFSHSGDERIGKLLQQSGWCVTCSHHPNYICSPHRHHKTAPQNPPNFWLEARVGGGFGTRLHSP